MNSRTLIVIPTVDEDATIGNLCKEILCLVDASILIVDDASQDQTREVVQQLAQSHPRRVHMLFRPKRTGIGAAYQVGLRWALHHAYREIIQMDGDGSHEPRFLPPMIAALKKAPLVVNSRYVPGARVEERFMRQAQSRFGNALARIFLSGSLRDLTGGFNGWHASLLARLMRKPFSSSGHGFQMELKFRALEKAGAVIELPIHFKPRTFGQSKLRWHHFLESLQLLYRLRIERDWQSTRIF